MSPSDPFYSPAVVTVSERPDGAGYDVLTEKVPGPPVDVIEQAAIMWTVLGEAQRALILEQMKSAGDLGGLEPGDRDRFRAAMPGMPGITLWDLLRWWPIIQAFAIFIQAVQGLPSGQTTTSPEFPFPVPFAGKSIFLSLNVRAP